MPLSHEAIWMKGPTECLHASKATHTQPKSERAELAFAWWATFSWLGLQVRRLQVPVVIVVFSCFVVSSLIRPPLYWSWLLGASSGSSWCSWCNVARWVGLQALRREGAAQCLHLGHNLIFCLPLSFLDFIDHWSLAGHESSKGPLWLLPYLRRRGIAVRKGNLVAWPLEGFAAWLAACLPVTASATAKKMGKKCFFFEFLWNS